MSSIIWRYNQYYEANQRFTDFYSITIKYKSPNGFELITQYINKTRILANPRLSNNIHMIISMVGQSYPIFIIVYSGIFFNTFYAKCRNFA